MPLYIQGKVDGLACTREFEQQAIARALYDGAAPFFDAGLNFALAQRHPALVSANLIELHQLGVADDIDEDHGCKTPEKGRRLDGVAILVTGWLGRSARHALARSQVWRPRSRGGRSLHKPVAHQCTLVPSVPPGPGSGITTMRQAH